MARLKGELLASRNSVKALKQSLEEANQQLAMARQEAAAAVRPAGATDAGAGARGPRQYRVREGDNLTEIAKEMYEDGRKWHLIYDANREVLKRPDDLQAGQTLVIPSLNNES